MDQDSHQERMCVHAQARHGKDIILGNDGMGDKSPEY